jgi:hypothetical protein
VRRGAYLTRGWKRDDEARRVPGGGVRRREGLERSRTCRRGRPGRRRDPSAAKEVEIADDGGEEGPEGFFGCH